MISVSPPPRPSAALDFDPDELRLSAAQTRHRHHVVANAWCVHDGSCRPQKRDDTRTMANTRENQNRLQLGGGQWSE